MTITLMPDIEDGIIDYLLTSTDLQALVSSRIYPELPPSVVYPLLTARVLSSRTGAPRWLEAVTLEVAGWSHRDLTGARKLARNVCETGVAVLYKAVNKSVSDCLICGPVATVGPRSVPDTIAEGVTNPRFIAEVTLTYHPA